MQVHVETRGRSADYGFLGSAPARRWWLEYGQHSRFEARTVLVRSRTSGWEAYVSGIDSSRRDSTGRAIRFALALEGGEGGEPALLALLEAALPGDDGARPDVLASALDRAFPDGFVEAVLAGSVEDRDEEVLRRAHAALRELPAAAGGSGRPAGGGHLGSARDAGDRERFLARAVAIARGRRGQALLLNLVRRDEDVDALFARHRTSVILAAGPVERVRRPIAPPRAPGDVHHVAMVGPAATGRTTLVSAIVADCQQLLGGKRVSLQARGVPTDERIAENQRRLERWIATGETGPADPGDEEPFVFELSLAPPAPHAAIDLDLVAIPRLDRPVSQRAIKLSTVLVVPVDATVLMEATQSAHRQAAGSILATDMVEDGARGWARERSMHPDTPALVLVCPLRCESYFADNGGVRDQSGELRRRVRETYDQVLRTVHTEAPAAQVWCIPIDTIGCVELTTGRWSRAPDRPGGFEFEASYRVRRSRQRTVKGVDDLLVLLCKHVIASGRPTDPVERAADRAPSLQDFLYEIPVVGDVFRSLGEVQREPPRPKDRERVADSILRELAERDLGARAFQL